MTNLSLPVAFVAGVVSFLSPCVLPIIPGFLAYLGGSTLEQAENRRLQTFLNAVFFVLGFSVVFAVLGVLLNGILLAAAASVQTWLARIGGAVVILFGLYLAELVPLEFLARSRTFQPRHRFSSPYLTSFVFGAAFAAGWTPCVGAVLGSILGLALASPGGALALLLSYSIGLGAPFLIVGLFASSAAGLLSRWARWTRIVTILFGIALVFLGILAFTQNLNRIANLELLNRWLLR